MYPDLSNIIREKGGSIRNFRYEMCPPWLFLQPIREYQSARISLILAIYVSDDLNALSTFGTDIARH
jgi:hypothetical protein